jgi:hypothetical protein
MSFCSTKLPLHLNHIFDFSQTIWLSEAVGIALPLAITNGACTLNVEQLIQVGQKLNLTIVTKISHDCTYEQP